MAAYDGGPETGLHRLCGVTGPADPRMTSGVKPNVPVLLEMLASRYLTSDFDNEQMRADRARRRLA
jgi:hypothetical protein